MTIELRPMGVACNLGCTYCYQEPMREVGNIKTKYDIDRMIAEVEKVNQKFNLFGGEALLIPKKDLEILFAYGFKKFGGSGLQTNGTLIDDDHIELFKKYNVGVGLSIDGPGELNDLRVVRAKKDQAEKTRQATRTIMKNIVKLVQHGVNLGVIVTLHRLNGTPDKLEKLMEFISWLGDIGLTNGNIHVLEVDKTMPDQDIHVLQQEENAEAFLTLARFFNKNPQLSWLPFRDMKDMLRADDSNATCYWNYCDHMNTRAVYGIEGDGSLSNCGRTNKEGIDWYKADDTNYARYVSLYNTPDELGGCQGCRFWITCGGSCVGEAADGDFRNKTLHCKTMKAVQGYYEGELEKEGILPITKSPYLKQVEDIMYNKMFLGETISLKQALHIAKGGAEVTTSKGCGCGGDTTNKGCGCGGNCKCGGKSKQRNVVVVPVKK